MPTPPQVAIIILAAGASTRMGTPKQLLPYRGNSLLRNITESAIASACKPVIVILGANLEKIRSEISHLPIYIVENLQWSEGMNASIRSGIQFLNGLTDPIEAVVIALCDQPFVSSQTINRLVDAYHSSSKAIVASEYAGTLGVPALFSRSIFPEMLNSTITHGAKQIIEKYARELVRIPFPEGAIDIDTPQDYQRLLPYK